MTFAGNPTDLTRGGSTPRKRSFSARRKLVLPIPLRPQIKAMFRPSNGSGNSKSIGPS